MLSLEHTDQNNLFTLALGLAEPWNVQDINFSEEKGKLDIYLKHKKGAKFNCLTCNQLHGIYDTTERTWRHLNFFQYEAYLHAKLPRIHCSTCNTTTNVSVPWARPHSGFTLLFEALTMELAQAMPLTTAGKILGEYDKRLMRIVEHYVEQARGQVNMSAINTVGFDETSKAKGHSYVTTVIDMDKKRVLFVTAGRDNTTIIRFCEDLKEHGGTSEQITQACADLSPAYTKGVTEQLQNAELVYDRFHVMKLVNEALDTVRREEVKENPLLKRSRYAWLHNPETATDNQTKQLETLTTLNLKTVRAYNMRLALRDIYELKNPHDAEIGLKKWYYWATHSRIPAMIMVAKTIKKHWDGIMAFFTKRITNGLVEGINSIIQTIKRRARGYRNTNNFITMIYLICGKLEFQLPRVCGITHGK